MQLEKASAAGELPDPRSDEFVAKLSAALRQRGLIDELALARAERARLQANERFDLALMRLGLIHDSALAEEHVKSNVYRLSPNCHRT